MSDHFAASITIGGPIPQRLVEPLCQAIAQERLSLEWGDAPFKPASAQDLLDACTNIHAADVLQLCDEHAPWGEFVDLEKFLIAQGIAFDRSHEAKFDVNARLSQFRAGGKLISFNTSVEGHVVVPLRDALCLRNDVRKACELLAKKRSEPAERKLQSALEGFARLVVEPAAPLSALQIVAD